MALKLGYNVTNFVLDFDGVMGGMLSSFTPPTMEVDKISQALGPDAVTKQMHGNLKFGEAKMVYNMSQTGKMWTICKSVLDKACTEFNMAVILADQDYVGKRRIDMMGCMVKELSFPKLEAKDGKKHMEMTITATVENVKFGAESAKIQGTMAKNAKNWLVSNFEPIGPGGGIKPDSFISIEIPKYTLKIAEEHTGMRRVATRHYSAWELSGLKSEHSSTGFKEVQDYCVKILQDGDIKDSEFHDWGVDVKNQTMKQTLCTFNFIQTAPQKFTWSPELKGGQDGMATCTVEYMIEEMTVENQHQG
jgi:hypothetical protein